MLALASLIVSAVLAGSPGTTTTTTAAPATTSIQPTTTATSVVITTKTTSSSSAPSPTGPVPHLVSSVSLSNVAFANIMPDNSLYLSTFTGNPFGSDAEYFIPDG
ncbi:hypothetical protein HDV03_004013, partial [Kappamyces sp. JEL0829]